MANKNNNDLFFICSLIEYIGRKKKLSRGDVVKQLGKDTIARIYEYADVFHCEPIEKVAEEITEERKVISGEFDNVKECNYEVPDYWTMGEVYERLIEDIASEETIIDTLIEIYQSWIDKFLNDYNIAVYYQPREYIAECYREGKHYRGEENTGIPDNYITGETNQWKIKTKFINAACAIPVRTRRRSRKNIKNCSPKNMRTPSPK